MKTILSILIVSCISFSASAISLSWQLAGLKFGSTDLKNAGTEFSAQLVYLGNGGSFNSSYSMESLTKDLDIVASSTSTTGKGINTGSYDLPVAAPSANGDVYGMLLTYVSGGVTYYNLAASTYTVSGIADATSGLDQYKIAAADQNFSVGAEGVSTISAGSGWAMAAAVPEPATGALALAGIALLFKRRKARA